MDETIPDATEFNEFLKLFNSTEIQDIVKGTSGLRKLLLYERCTPDQVLGATVLPRLVAFLESSSPEDLLYETCWMMSIFAFLQYIKEIVGTGLLVPLVKLLSLDTTSDRVRDKITFCLGNVTKQSLQCRQQLLELGIMKYLIEIVENTSDQQLLRNSAWLVALLGRGPYPPLQMTIGSVGILHKFLENSDPEIQLEGIRGISYIAARPEGIQSVIDSGSVKRVVEIMNHSETSTFVALTMIASMGMGQPSQSDYMIDLGGLKIILELLDNPSSRIKAHAFVGIGNFLANPSQIQKAIDLGFFSKFATFGNSATKDFNSLCEIVIIFNNATLHANEEQIEYFVSIGLIPLMCKLSGLEIKYASLDIPNLVLKTFINLFKTGDTLKEKNNGINPYTQAFKVANGLASLRFCVGSSRDPERSRIGSHIITAYFPEILNSNTPPLVNNNTATPSTTTTPPSTTSTTPSTTSTTSSTPPTANTTANSSADEQNSKGCIIN
ncbi:hypothetical protein CYY_003968 [Polysphondylium violaceum]|uniref:Importin subunit alpha n=1 Tax=Polysphondylium violaceum TaxID=133409 RepID=A0A8J4PW62_9MYCE|nr:hypothetical protein CYY_003968 [Polysphondylium violaceum]